ncbi:MAG: response regulator [Thermoguttaceae bacterium]
MLVLSRRQDDKIIFPNLGITVEILRIAGQSVRIGVEAPSDVRVLRHELADKSGETAGDGKAATPQISMHQLRNRLNKAVLGLYVLQRQLEAGIRPDADETLEKVLSEFHSLDEFLAGEKQPSPKEPRLALVVEDDANESELLAGFLRMSGYEVATASDGCDALDYLAAGRQPDVVLLDMQMPRCDGPSTIVAIRENPKYDDLRLFGVSGREPAEVGVTVGPQGVDRWFRKPLNPQLLVNQINRDLELAALRA